MFYKEIRGITHPCKKAFLLSLCAKFVKPFSARVYTVSDINDVSWRMHFMLLKGHIYTTIYCGTVFCPSLAQIVPCCRNRLFFSHRFPRIDGGRPVDPPFAVRRLRKRHPPAQVEIATECFDALVRGNGGKVLNPANPVDFAGAAMVNENLVMGSIRSPVQPTGQPRHFIARMLHRPACVADYDGRTI